MIESIEKLRDELRICETTGSRPTIAFVAQCADEIEAEIAERYMLKPDAEIDKTAVQEYNLDVQVVAEPKIEYTAELRHRCGATTSISVAFRLE